jgi:C-terminal processing protease CtpA/Prc
LAFKGRENTIFIGEKTNGKTTSNMIADLPFGAYMTLTIGYDCDRNGNFYDSIVPDIEIKNQDNFDNLLLDGNIVEAINFIRDKK